MFHNPTPKKPVSTFKKALKDLTRMTTASTILADNKRQTVLQSIRELMELEDQRYTSLCENLLKTLTHYFQLLPATSNSFYAQSGGLLDHALFRTEAALQLLKQFTILETDNQLTEEQKLWQYALFSASLLQGAGKLYAEYQIERFDEQGNYLSMWNPLSDSLHSIGYFYDYQFDKNPTESFKQRLNVLMARSIMPASGFNWISSNPAVLEVWLALLQEDQAMAGTLGAILIRADALAIQFYFNNMLVKFRSKIRKPGTFHADLPESLADKEQQAGFAFILWLNKALSEGHLVLNKAPLLMVPAGMVMCDELYQLFVREHPEYKNWQAVQKGFLSLGLHATNSDGSTQAHFKQGEGKAWKGDVFSKYALTLPESVQVLNNTTGKTTAYTAMEVVHASQFNSQLNRVGPILETQTLPLLSATGDWKTPEQASAPKPGILPYE